MFPPFLSQPTPLRIGKVSLTYFDPYPDANSDPDANPDPEPNADPFLVGHIFIKKKLKVHLAEFLFI